MKFTFQNRSTAFALCLALGGTVCTSSINAQDATNAPESAAPAPSATSEADKAWAETERTFQPPTPPAEWSTQRPTEEEVAKFRELQGKLATHAAQKAREFYTKYPNHEKAAEAKEKERQMLQIGVQRGNEEAIAALDKLDEAKLNDPTLPEDERFELKARAMLREVKAKSEEDEAAGLAAYEQGARKLMKEFPKRDEPYRMLLSLTDAVDADKAKSIAQEIVNSEAPEQAKEAAQDILKSYAALGKPLHIKFTAADGREVDLPAMKGKVVLVDFWATWCGPCVAELPHVKQAYADLHSKGFEIVGISFDKDKEALTNFVKKHDMAWPQYFDGQVWENKFGVQYGIHSIPAMWLVDKKGNLVDMNARGELEKKVKKLLAE